MTTELDIAFRRLIKSVLHEVAVELLEKEQLASDRENLTNVC